MANLTLQLGDIRERVALGRDYVGVVARHDGYLEHRCERPRNTAPMRLLARDSAGLDRRMWGRKRRIPDPARA